MAEETVKWFIDTPAIILTSKLRKMIGIPKQNRMKTGYKRNG
jgi:hypothetical protein